MIMIALDWGMIGCCVTILGGMYVFSRDIKQDIKQITTNHREDVTRMEDKWHALLKEIHEIDKKIYKIELKREK